MLGVQEIGITIYYGLLWFATITIYYGLLWFTIYYGLLWFTGTEPLARTLHENPDTWCMMLGVQGSCLRLIDSCITQLKDQGPSRTCNESKEEEKKVQGIGITIQDYYGLLWFRV